MKKKGLLRISAGLAAAILSGATLVGCGETDGPGTNETQKDVDLSVAAITNKDALSEEWGVNGGQRTITLAQSVAKIRSDGLTLEFKSSNETVATVDGAGKITPLTAGTAKFTVLVNGKEADSIEITFVTASYTSIEAVTKDVLEKNGDKTTVYSFKGVVTLIIGTKAFTVQQGNYAFYVYKNAAAVCEGHPLAVGDVVAVTTTAQLYKGLIESNDPTTIEYLADETAETINAKVVQNKDLNNDLQSVLVNANNLSAVGALTAADSNTYGVLEVRDGTADDKLITIYVNKYLESSVMTAINEKLSKLANEAYTANLKGVVVSICDNFQYLVTDPNQIELVAAAAVNPTKVEVTNKTELSQLIVGTSATISMGYEPENCNAKAMDYVSSDPTIATVSAEGKIVALKDGKTTITATSSAVNTLKDEFELTVIAPKFVANPIVGEEYYMAFDCSNGVCYFNGEMDGYYGKTVADKADAVKFGLVKGTDANEGKFALKASNGKYIDIEVGDHINFKYVDQAAYFSYDSVNFCYYKTVDGKNYYFGTYNTYATASAGEGVRTYPARFYPVYANEAPQVGSTVKIGTYHYNLETPGYLYLNGELDGTYYKTGEADVFTVEAGTAENTYALKTSAGKYLSREQQTNDKGNTFYACTLADAKSTATDYVWNQAIMSYETVTVDPGKCIGTSGTKTYTTLGYSKKDYSDMCWCHVYVVDSPKGHGETENDPLTTTEALEIAKGLKANEASEKMYFIKGKVAKIATAFAMQYGNCSVWITDDGVATTEDNMFELYKLSGLNGNKLMSETDIEVGDEVVTKAKIKYYHKDADGKNAEQNVYETADACPVVSINKVNSSIRGIVFDKESAKLAIGETATLKAGIAPTTLGKDASKITWAVDKSDIATLSAAAGNEITITAVAAGEATVTASWKENDQAEAITKTFKVTVEAPFSGMKLNFDGSVAPTTKSGSKVEWTVDGCKFTVEKGTSTTDAGNTDQGYIGNSTTPEIRLYKGQKVTFSKPEGKTISYIEVAVTNSNTNFEGNTFTNATFEKVSGSGTIGISNPYIYKINPKDGTKDVSIDVAKGAHRFAYVKIVLAD